MVCSAIQVEEWELACEGSAARLRLPGMSTLDMGTSPNVGDTVIEKTGGVEGY